jgi:hypothetical protein
LPPSAREIGMADRLSERKGSKSPGRRGRFEPLRTSGPGAGDEETSPERRGTGGRRVQLGLSTAKGWGAFVKLCRSERSFAELVNRPAARLGLSLISRLLRG